MGFGYGVYFSERERNRVVRWDPDTGEADVIAGEPADGDKTQTLRDPYGLAFDSGGNLLITDKMNCRIVRLKKGRLEELPLKDVTGHRNRLKNSSPGYQPFPICAPSGIWAEKGKSLLVSFHDDGTVYRIGPDGRIELLLGMVPNRNYFHAGTRETVPIAELPDTPMRRPTGIVSRSDGTIYVIERGYQLLREYRPGKAYRSLFPMSKQKEWYRKTPPAGDLPFSDYACVYPGSLALDQDENLYMTEVNQRCIMKIDVQAKRARKVLDSRQDPGAGLGGISALSFGSDGTAWVMDAAAGGVEGYRTDRGIPWTPSGVALREIRGKPLRLAPGGAGLITGK